MTPLVTFFTIFKVSRVHLNVILCTFSQRLQNSIDANFLGEMLGLGGVGPPFLHDSSTLLKCFVSIAF